MLWKEQTFQKADKLLGKVTSESYAKKSTLRHIVCRFQGKKTFQSETELIKKFKYFGNIQTRAIINEFCKHSAFLESSRTAK